jgi:hypothetical protein
MSYYLCVGVRRSASPSPLLSWFDSLVSLFNLLVKSGVEPNDDDQRVVEKIENLRKSSLFVYAIYFVSNSAVIIDYGL